MSAAISSATRRREWLTPFFVGVPFSTIVTGLAFSNNLPLPVALAVGVAWGLLIGLIATWIKRRAVLSAWLEDGLVFVGAIAMALGAGGVLGLLMMRAAIQSPSLSGQTLVQMFLPAVPWYIVVNTTLELLVIPSLIYLGWRAGQRRVLILTAAVLFFGFRVWSYLAFVPNRLAFAELEGSKVPFTPAESQQAYADLQLDDPRPILGFPILVVLFLMMYFSRVRELKAVGPS